MPNTRPFASRLAGLFEFGGGRRFVEPLQGALRSKWFTYGALLFALVFWIFFFWFGYHFPGEYSQ